MSDPHICGLPDCWKRHIWGSMKMWVITKRIAY
jgi:hypothetical protein